MLHQNYSTKMVEISDDHGNGICYAQIFTKGILVIKILSLEDYPNSI